MYLFGQKVLEGNFSQVVQYIKDGNVLECPENTPKSVYKLMTMCWSSSPSNRPCFRSESIFRVTADADAIIYNADIEPDAYFLLIQDPPPGTGHDRGRDCVDTEALTLAAFYPSVAQVFCIGASFLQHQPNGFPCFRLLSKATDLIPKKKPTRML